MAPNTLETAYQGSERHEGFLALTGVDEWTLSVSPTAADLRADAGFVTTGDAEQNAYTIAPASFA